MTTAADDRVPARLRAMPSWLLTHTATHASRLVSESFATIGARRYHYALLAALDEFGPLSQAALGRHCGIDRSDVVAAVNELAADGLVLRRQDSADRRRNVITLTPMGRNQLASGDRVLAEAQEKLLGPLSATERAELTRLLARLFDHHA
ncbi:MarR family winged helix-turn-helix transcriptional regulator [Streptomyces sp. NBRC 109706]|uniref:MarR family winged helix-turn-helix transcriptional regulator n=1 Tax=Streptomyces sp. NBRC 109706 TaxID=1550035 RepID=UPI000782BC3A|nr:MarR family transcriptional regulator [Streptomyces sp. NBRC 109706]